MIALIPPKTSAERRFLDFLEGQRGTLYKVAYVYCRDAEERRDLLQDMVVQLWRSFDGFDGRSAPSTWTWRVAVNVAISHRRRHGRRIKDALPLDLAFDVADESFASDSDASKRLRALVETLDEMNRALILLHFEGFDHAEIAGLLGTTAGAVATRFNRIKTKLREQLANEE